MFTKCLDGSNTDKKEATPVKMTGALSGKIVVGVVAGPSFSLCRVSTGQVYGFGSNADGELGDGTRVCFNPMRLIQ
jgi:alpha-tubulin suppressor-like RCC1 family protein